MANRKETVTSDPFSVSISRTVIDDNGIERLKSVIRSKESLLKSAFGASSLPLEVTEDKVTFPWFTIEDGKEAAAYCTFIVRLCEHAKSLSRVNSKKEKDVDNKKYAFRCFLLRLGLIGDSYKETRKVLMKNLSGSAAFRTPAVKEVAV